jgi:hypothetical protein
MGRGRQHVQIRLQISERFDTKGGLQSNLESIFSQLSLQTAVMSV